MGLFRPYERSEKSERNKTNIVGKQNKRAAEPAKEQLPVDETVQDQDGRKPKKKNRPTPTRAQAEAARMERLHPTMSPKELRKAEREAKYQARAEAWERMENSPEQRLMRDFVDTRWTVTEFLMPVFILVLALTFIFVGNGPATLYISIGMYTIFFICLINVWLMWRSFKALLAQRLPKASRRGLLIGMINRAMMIRRFRRPSPRIKRGEAI